MKPSTVWFSFKTWALGIPVRMKIMGIAFGLLVLMGFGVIIEARWSLAALLDGIVTGRPASVMPVPSDPVVHGKTLEEFRKDALTTITYHLSEVIGIIALVGIGVAYFLTGLITTPIRELVAVTESVGRGDFRRKAQVHANDEVGQLSTAFNAMIDRLRDTQEELRHKEQMRSQLLRQVIFAQEEERQRIARELHDQIGQTLTSILVGLKVIETTDASENVHARVAELRSFVTQAFDEVHNLALNLRPSVLDDLGLPAALRRYVDGFSRQFAIPVDYQTIGFDHEVRLPTEVETTVYRIVQEMLTNVVRHANATTVNLLLQHNLSRVQVIVDDDGVGFDVSAVLSARGRQHLGLFGMQERASLFGGTLTVESTPGSGTTVIVDIPLGKGARNGTDPDSVSG